MFLEASSTRFCKIDIECSSLLASSRPLYSLLETTVYVVSQIRGSENVPILEKQNINFFMGKWPLKRFLHHKMLKSASEHFSLWLAEKKSRFQMGRVGKQHANNVPKLGWLKIQGVSLWSESKGLSSLVTVVGWTYSCWSHALGPEGQVWLFLQSLLSIFLLSLLSRLQSLLSRLCRTGLGLLVCVGHVI
jgi:hypothetical protein